MKRVRVSFLFLLILLSTTAGCASDGEGTESHPASSSVQPEAYTLELLDVGSAYHISDQNNSTDRNGQLASASITFQRDANASDAFAIIQNRVRIYADSTEAESKLNEIRANIPEPNRSALSPDNRTLILLATEESDTGAKITSAHLLRGTIIASISGAHMEDHREEEMRYLTDATYSKILASDGDIGQGPGTDHQASDPDPSGDDDDGFGGWAWFVLISFSVVGVLLVLGSAE